MYSHEILRSLKNIAAVNPMASALGTAGLADPTAGIQHGAKASPETVRPFALLNVEKVEEQPNTSGVILATYLVTLQVIADRTPGLVGDILVAFHRYWDRIANLETLDPGSEGRARFIQIYPGETDIGEAEQEDRGQDVILGTTTWTVQLSEHQPEL